MAFLLFLGAYPAVRYNLLFGKNLIKGFTLPSGLEKENPMSSPFFNYISESIQFFRSLKPANCHLKFVNYSS
jgi:hypothetical protein